MRIQDYTFDLFFFFPDENTFELKETKRIKESRTTRSNEERTRDEKGKMKGPKIEPLLRWKTGEKKKAAAEKKRRRTKNTTSLPKRVLRIHRKKPASFSRDPEIDALGWRLTALIGNAAPPAQISERSAGSPNVIAPPLLAAMSYLLSLSTGHTTA